MLSDTDHLSFSRDLQFPLADLTFIWLNSASTVINNQPQLVCYALLMYISALPQMTVFPRLQ